MSQSSINVLFIETNPADALALQAELEKDVLHTFILKTAESLRAGLLLLKQAECNIVLLNLDLPDSCGIGTFEQLHRQFPTIPVIVCSSNTDEHVAITAVQLGAQDYIVKGRSGWGWASRAIRHTIERHQAQIALRLSEQRFRALIEHNANAIALVAADGYILYASPASIQTVGYQPAEMEGHHIFDFLQPAERTDGQALFDEVLQHPQQAITRQVPYTDRHHTQRWIEVTLTNWLANPSVKAIVVNYYDITERKQLETERQTLLAIMHAAVLTDDLSEFLRRVHHALAAVIYAENFFVALYNPQTATFETAYVVDQYDAPDGPHDYRKSITAYVFRTGCPLLLNEHSAFEALLTSGEVELGGTNAPSWVGIPLKTTQASIGVMVLQDYTVAQRYSAHDRDFLTSIAGQIALAVQRKQAAAELAIERARLRALINTIPAVVWLKDPDGVYLAGNTMLEQVLGVSEAVFNGKTDQELFPTEQASLFRQDDHAAIAAGKPTTTEHWSTFASDGHRALMETIKTPMYDSRGQLIGVLGIARDITERKEAELLLEERVRTRTAEIELTRERLELATNVAGIGIWEWDGATGRMHWDDQMLRLYCLTRADFDETRNIWERVVHPDDFPAQRDLFEAVLRQERAYATEFRTLWPDQSEHYIKANAIILFNADGRPERAVGINYDITTHKQAEQLLRNSEETLRQANRELERALRMKDEFLASMSHELRTPLTAVLGLSESLQYKTYGELNERQLKALANIEGSGRHLLALINDILDLSKIEANKFELHIEPCNLSEICHASMQMVKVMGQKKQQQIDFTLHPPLIHIRGDPRRIKQILVNLLSNAIKFTPEHGALGLEVVGDMQAQLVRMTVWDKGIGIKVEDMGRLFQPFVQLDSSLSRHQAGTGLGLSLVQRLIGLHGGDIQVESTLGVGSRFTVTLPL